MISSFRTEKFHWRRRGRIVMITKSEEKSSYSTRFSLSLALVIFMDPRQWPAPCTRPWAHFRTTVWRNRVNSVKGIGRFHAQCKLHGCVEDWFRAYINGRLDLTEAEGLIDLINAQTEQQRKQSLFQMQGSLKELYERWRVDLVRVNRVTKIKAMRPHVPFPFEVVGPCRSVHRFPWGSTHREWYSERWYRARRKALITVQQLLLLVINQVKTTYDQITSHLQDHRRGEILRDGCRIAILGAPNAGKVNWIWS